MDNRPLFTLFIMTILIAGAMIWVFHIGGVNCPSWDYINGMACEACTRTCRPINFIGGV